MCATISSCSSAPTVTTSEPSVRQNATVVSTAAALLSASGVTKQVRCSNSRAVPCSHPVFSEPAIGWAPIKWAFAPTAAWPSRAISPFTLPTSVTTAPGGRAEAICAARATILSTGEAMTTRLASRTASSGVSATASHHG